jgi:hypothetical protein
MFRRRLIEAGRQYAPPRGRLHRQCEKPVPLGNPDTMKHPVPMESRTHATT